MTDVSQILVAQVGLPRWTVELAWMGSVLLALGMVQCWAYRRRAARSHRLLALALISTLAIPLGCRFVRALEWGLLPPSAVLETPVRSELGTSIEDALLLDAGFVVPRVSLQTNGGSTPATARRFDGPARRWTSPVLGAEAGPSPVQLSASSFAASTWLTLSIAGLSLLLAAAYRSAKLLKGSRALDSNDDDRCRMLHSTLQNAGARLGCDRLPALRSSDSLSSPAIWCWGRRPAILLPRALLRSADPIDWEALLCHELAHLKRRDHLTDLAGRVVLLTMPWNPLAWWCRSRLSRLAEQACDDWVLATGRAGETAHYAETLLALSPSRTALLPIAAAGRRGSLSRRIRALLDSRPRVPELGKAWSRGSVIFTVTLVALLACVQPGLNSTTVAAPSEQPHPVADSSIVIAPESPHSLSGVVLDEDGRPAPDVTVTLVREYLDDPMKPVQGQLTDDRQGRRRAHDRAGHDVAGAGRRKRATHRGRDAHAQGTEPVRPAPGPVDRADAAGRFVVRGVRSQKDTWSSSPGFPAVSARVEGDAWTHDLFKIFELESDALPEVVLTLRRAGEDPAIVEVAKPSSGTIAAVIGEPVGTATLQIIFEGNPVLPSGRRRTIYLMHQTTDGSVSSEQTLDDAGGCAFDRLPAGSYRVVVPTFAPPGYPPQPVNLVAGETATLMLRKGPVLLRGRVRSGGQPVTAGTIEVTALGPGMDGSAPLSYGDVAVDGSYSVDGLPFGLLRVSYGGTSNNSPPNNFRVQADQADMVFDIELPRTRIDIEIADRVGFVVEDQLTGRIATIHAYPGGSAPMGGNTAGFIEITEGELFFQHLPPGPWTLQAYDIAKGRTLQARVVLDGPTSRVSAELRPTDEGTGVIVCRLVNSVSSSEIAGYEVSAMPVGSDGVDATARFGRTTVDADNASFTVSQLPAGTYGILMTPLGKGGRLWRGEIVDATLPCLWIGGLAVGEGETITREVTVPEARAVSIRLDVGEQRAPYQTWRLDMGAGQLLPFHLLIGSSPRARRAGRTAFPWPVGRQSLLVDLGRGTLERFEFVVEPGEGVQEVVVDMASSAPRPVR